MHSTPLAKLAALLMLPTLVACGAAEPGADADEPRLGTQASAIQDGESAPKSANFAVGIASRDGSVCSGTLIAPNLVLTARHCVVPSDGEETVSCKDSFPTTNVPASTLFVSPDSNLHGTKKFYAVRTITTPAATAFCGNDIAVLELKDEIPASEAQPATPVVQFAMTDRSRISGQIAAVGYGITNPSAEDSGLRRIREGIDILCVPGDSSYSRCTGTAKSLVDNDKEFITAGYVCSGDSGGGAFDQASLATGTPYVLGALSRGPQTKSECLAAVYSRTDAHAEMILEAAAVAFEHGTYDRPEWLTPSWEAPVVGCDGEICTAVDATSPVVAPSSDAGGCSAASSGAPTSSSAGLFAALGLGVLVVARRRRAA